MKEIDIFNQQFGNIRTFQTDNQDILFVAVDVAKALGYKNVDNAIKRHCTIASEFEINPPLSRGGVNLSLNLKDINGREQSYRLLDEPNLYKLIFGSRLPSATTFTHWVAESVLPCIRKFGTYPAPENGVTRVTLPALKPRTNTVAALTFLLDSRNRPETAEAFFIKLRGLGYVHWESYPAKFNVIDSEQFGKNELQGSRTNPLFFDAQFDLLLELVDEEIPADEVIQL